MQDAWRAYLDLALGLTEAPRKRAQDVARRLVGSGGATAAQLQALAEEILATSAANREALTKLVRFEVDRTLGAVGLATADEVAELTRRVHELERRLREARTISGPEASDAAAPTPEAPPGDRNVAGKTVAKKAVAKKAVAKKAPTTVAKAPAEAPGRVAGTAAKKTTAKKVATKKVAAKKATGGGRSGTGDAGTGGAR